MLLQWPALVLRASKGLNGKSAPVTLAFDLERFRLHVMHFMFFYTFPLNLIKSRPLNLALELATDGRTDRRGRTDGHVTNFDHLPKVFPVGNWEHKKVA